MSGRTVDAIYENGVLRPLSPLDWLPEHGRVRLTVAVEGDKHPLGPCIGSMPDDDAEEMSRIVREEFQQVNPDEWK